MQQLTSFFFTLSLALGSALAEADCKSRDYGNGGTVCVCDSTYCDTLPSTEKLPQPGLLQFTSNKAGLRFKKLQLLFSTNTATKSNNKIISVKSGKQFQKIIGWGGAFTDAAGINVNSLTESARHFLMNAYFSDEGIRYSLGRVPIGGTDFSTRGYSYDDSPKPDKDLANFSLANEDHTLKIPLLKQAKALSNDQIQFFASAWTAPKWMKTNRAYSGLGGLLPDMYQVWANYFLKFLDAYHAQGIDFWGITTGNEPLLGLIPFFRVNAVGWLPWHLGKWISEYLGPTLRNSSHSSQIKIMVLDDQRIFLPWLVKLIFGVGNAREYVDGIAVHWYFNNFVPAWILTWTHNDFPEKFVLSTEACNGLTSSKKVALGSWSNGEKYANDIIDNMQNWVTGWVDWNLALDTQGGPTYVENYVDAPIIVNASSGEFYKQPMYYALGHFSRFVPRDSYVVEASTNWMSRNLRVVAFLRPDQSTAVVILNKDNKAVNVTLVDELRGSCEVEISAKAFVTFLYW